jgi:hypothetical protein
VTPCALPEARLELPGWVGRGTTGERGRCRGRTGRAHLRRREVHPAGPANPCPPRPGRPTMAR